MSQIFQWSKNFDCRISAASIFDRKILVTYTDFSVLGIFGTR